MIVPPPNLRQPVVNQLGLTLPRHHQPPLMMTRMRSMITSQLPTDSQEVIIDPPPNLLQHHCWLMLSSVVKSAQQLVDNQDVSHLRHQHFRFLSTAQDAIFPIIASLIAGTNTPKLIPSVETAAVLATSPIDVTLIPTAASPADLYILLASAHIANKDWTKDHH